VAAGLVTPVTGDRLALSWQWSEFYPACNALYEQIQRISLAHFWHVAPAWRVFQSDAERERFFQRWWSEEGKLEMGQQGIALEPMSEEQLQPFHAPGGGFSMWPAGRLDTRAYLDATAKYFRSRNRWFPIHLDLEQDLKFTPDDVRVQRLGLQSRMMVLCQGISARTNHWFHALPLHPARGDILELASDTLIPAVAHHAAWVVPLQATNEANDQPRRGRILLGATYDRNCLDTSIEHPNALGFRRELLQRWNSMMALADGRLGLDDTLTSESSDSESSHRRDRFEGEVLAHVAAVRPASYDRHPLIGPHPTQPNLFCLNGLGSKGSLMAPHLANLLLDCMLENQKIESQLHWRRRDESSRRSHDSKRREST